jgi:ribonuclease Z
VAHPGEERPFDGHIIEGPEYHVDACLMDHGTPCVAYCVHEQPRTNIDTDVLAGLGLRPGPWLKRLKETTAEPREVIQGDSGTYTLGALREQLLVTTPGDSIAYLTDFRLDGPSEGRLVAMLRGCRTIVCENNFRNGDRELAERSRHMVSAEVARLAAQAGAERLVLFHLSDRYTPTEWREQLAEVQSGFPQAEFPESWAILLKGQIT